MEFFQYYAWQFDFAKTVVSLQSGKAIPKVKKAETDGWTLNERLRLVMVALS